MNNLILAAFTIERRAVCFALFQQVQLDDVLVRQLPADEGRAATAVIGFLNQMIERDEAGYVAFISPPDSASARYRQLYEVSIQVIRARGIPCVEVPESKLLAAYGYPSLKRREQLRKVGRTIWPSLNSKAATRAAVDAAVLGLHVQVERLFNIQEVQP
jgi:hypothetical protein